MGMAAAAGDRDPGKLIAEADTAALRAAKTLF
jgi:hypothetical protein